MWANDNSNKVPWDSKIETALKKKLGMSYKLLKFRHQKTQFSKNKRLYIEAALAQCILSSTWHEIIFIDEFQIKKIDSEDGVAEVRRVLCEFHMMHFQ